MRFYRLALIVAVAAMPTACASLFLINCGDGDHIAVHDSLYFGTAKPDGVITAEEWADFLRNTVTPRFPQGFTTSQASGQWRGADGTVVREAAHILELVHPNNPVHWAAIREVIAAYKVQFQQEAVLRIRGYTCASL